MSISRQQFWHISQPGLSGTLEMSLSFERPDYSPSLSTDGEVFE